MDIENVKYEGNSKFMWDGEPYESREAAESKKKEYEEKDFEVRMCEQEGKHLLYSRRVVTEIVLEGPPPA